MSITPTSGSGGFEPQVDQSTQADTSSSTDSTSQSGSASKSGSTIGRTYTTGAASKDNAGKAKQLCRELGKANRNLNEFFRPSPHAVTQQPSSQAGQSQLSPQKKADMLRKRINPDYIAPETLKKMDGAEKAIGIVLNEHKNILNHIGKELDDLESITDDDSAIDDEYDTVEDDYNTASEALDQLDDLNDRFKKAKTDPDTRQEIATDIESINAQIREINRTLNELAEEYS